MKKYKNIKTKESYSLVLKSGMFWCFYPELTGNWEKDKDLIMKNFEDKLKIELDKLPYTKHVDDGQYNDGQLEGFELGARWAINLSGVGLSLPDIYSGELNTKRIAAYRKLAELYNVEEGTIRDAFCKGADWYKELIDGNKA